MVVSVRITDAMFAFWCAGVMLFSTYTRLEEEERVSNRFTLDVLFLFVCKKESIWVLVSIIFYFALIYLERWSNLTFAYVSNGLVQPPPRKHVARWSTVNPSEVPRIVSTENAWHPHRFFLKLSPEPPEKNAGCFGYIVGFYYPVLQRLWWCIIRIQDPY